MLETGQSDWDNLYEVDPQFFGAGESEFATHCCQLMRDFRAANVLEIGCGYGRDTIFLAERGFRVTALDYSEKGLAILNEKISTHPATANIETVPCDICGGIPFGDGVFDAVYSFLLFPVGFTDTQMEFAFSEIHRVLRKNGLLLCSIRSDVAGAGFFNEGDLHSRLDGFQIDNLVSGPVSVGKYQVNVLGIFARKT